MKRTIKGMAMALLITGGLVFTPQPMPVKAGYTILAEDFIDEGDKALWNYKVIDSESGISSEPFAELTSYKGSSTEIHIPRTIGGYPVMKLGKGLISTDFEEKSTTMYIPDCVKSADSGFIGYMFDLTIFMEDGMVYECTGDEMKVMAVPHQKEVYIPDDVFGIPVTEIDKLALNYPQTEDNPAVEKLRLSDNITDFSFSSFHLRSINVPKKMHIIPSKCFAGNLMPMLEEVEFHDGINLIAGDAFIYSSVEPPQDKVVNNIDEITSHSLSYTEADFEKGWCYTINLDHEGNIVDAYLKYAPDLQGTAPSSYRGIPVTDLRLTDHFPDYMPYMIIREGTKSTVNYNNSTHKALKKVDIYSTDLILDKDLFLGASIEELFFPGSVECQDFSVYRCTELKKVEFGGKDSVIKIGSQAFDCDDNLTELIFPDSCNELSIGKSAFSGCAIRELTIPEGTVSIDSDAFSNNEKLEEITINGSPKIESGAFVRTKSLKNLVINGNPDLDKNVFQYSTLENIDVDITKDLNGWAFIDCPNLTKINGEEVFDENGVPLEKYRDFLNKNFNDSRRNGIVDQYAVYLAKQTVKETITEDMSDIEKVRVLHDKVCSMVCYDTEDPDNWKNGSDVAVFIHDKAVCAGYARAYNLMLHEAGIESCYVTTADHAWVIVKLGDSYFHVDPTWDDGDTVCYDWFLVTDSKMENDPSHSGFYIMEPSDIHSFQWKKMPECKYNIGDANRDGVIDANDASAILKSYVRTSLGEEMTVDAALGDFDMNGTVDALDASAVFNDYAKKSSYYG